MEYQIQAPFSAETIQQLHTGDMVKITGTIYSARDAAHKKLMELIEEGKDLPFELQGNVIYYL